MTVTIINPLSKEDKPVSVFKTLVEYQKFRVDYSSSVASKLDRYALARALSEREALDRLVD